MMNAEEMLLAVFEASDQLARARYAAKATALGSECTYDGLPEQRRNALFQEAACDIAALQGAGFIILKTEQAVRLLQASAEAGKNLAIMLAQNHLQSLAAMLIHTSPHSGGAPTAEGGGSVTPTESANGEEGK